MCGKNQTLVSVVISGHGVLALRKVELRLNLSPRPPRYCNIDKGRAALQPLRVDCCRIRESRQTVARFLRFGFGDTFSGPQNVLLYSRAIQLAHHFFFQSEQNQKKRSMRTG
jgi:hypothetical protein